MRPLTYAQVTKREPTRAPVASTNAPDLTSKAQQVTPGIRAVTRKKVSTPAKITSNESKQAQKNENRCGTEADVDIENIDSIWSMPRDFCCAGRRTGRTSPPPPAPRRQSSPSQPPPRASAPGESGHTCPRRCAVSGVIGMGTDGINVERKMNYV
ncbi:hypothetical protein ElyMa_005925300 [Elysia marginata]|uniref:Uncharacterized protein n=1 Tax=Elysia marginata TaxID=1093978 RepID=A0AAV4G8V5_9GAST|nr:hypothetical protein ElyMa_005925300 [Elysia marginata]